MKYVKSQINREGKKDSFYYNLSFKYTFDFNADVVYFAHSYPYTFTDLKEYLNSIFKDEIKNK